MRVGELGELGLIERMRPFAAPAAGGLLDDCAIIPQGASSIAVTTDAHVDGVHLARARMRFRDIGYRALAACLSDLAAVGADGAPRYLVALGLPGDLEVEDVEELYLGMAELGDHVGAELIGGDTVQSDRLFLAVTALSSVRRPLRRGGAQPGDLVFVSGAPGSAGRDLRTLFGDFEHTGDLRAFLRPVPRLKLGRALGELGASACADISDGLASELRAIARASGVGIAIDEDHFPSVAGVHRDEAIELAYRGGEDFELLFTLPPAAVREVARLQPEHGPVTKIGEVTAERGVVRAVRGGAARLVPDSGYVHHGGDGA